MRRVMIIGQPGSGKSTIARKVGEITLLPVVHIDLIHWKSGWIERTRPEKGALCAEVHAREKWIFEGGHSATWPERLQRCDTLIWLDYPLGKRFGRVLSRTFKYLGKSRPDMPEGCHERFSWEFYRWIWNTRHSGRELMERYYNQATKDKATYWLQNDTHVKLFLDNLKRSHQNEIAK